MSMHALAEDAKPAPTDKPRPAMMAPLAAKGILLDVEAAGARLVAVGQRGNIVVSDDGKDWKQVESPVDVMLNRVHFRDDKTGWVVGHDASILATSDGGLTWKLEHFEAGGKALLDVLPLDGGAAIAVGGYGTYFVRDAAGAWSARAFPVGDLGQHFNAIARLADGSLLIAGERGLLARSTDGGENWKLLDSPYVGSFFGVIPNGAGFIVFGLRGNIYVAADAAKVKALDPAEYDPFTRESVLDEALLVASGWTRLRSGTTETLFGSGAAKGLVLLVGVNGTALILNPANGTVERAPARLDETLTAALWKDNRWLAAGRRGVQDLGNLSWP